MKFTGKTVQKIAVMAAVSSAVLGLANPVFAAPTSVNDAAIVQAIETAITPGEGQKKLDAMIGTFAVKIQTWATPSAIPVESQATSISSWVLDGRYVQSMLSGYVNGAPFNGIGYMAYDNVTKTYQAAWMDTGSTGITWYTGAMDASGKSAIMKASVANPVTAKATPLELHVTLDGHGNHVTELWGTGVGHKMFKMMELRYTKVQ
jgi:hypothetical protein